MLCYIPTKVTSTKCQLNVYYLLTFKNNYNIFLYNLIIAEEYSKLEIVQYFELIKDKFYSTNNLKGNLFITSDIHLKKNTDFKCFNVSNLNSNASVFQNSNFYLKYNSHAQTLDLNFANKLNHTDKMIYLKSSGSRINTYVLNILLDNCEYTGNVNQIHLDKNTYSKVYQKNILLNSAKVYFKGLILLDKKSKDSCADQLNTSVCLTQQNVVCSIPTIEILNKNVKCTHGSSTGSFSSDEFFYMLSRGLNIIKIVKLFIFSFIYDIIKQFIIVNTKYIDLLNNSVRII
ncbi:SufD family Fe-S cluster assembly protein [Candidatus Pinguicoccus supinus]|uniref:SufD family Fe-S cluster assembly protein n=1 Tax=Candidatus Pinguicoccus supinus TaxID=2529394 RepID=A0A7T0BRM5_9BACT|nr:SufD family Fe-S cluster assembly protein [Candidatus Pinguicoccus supinus]